MHPIELTAIIPATLSIKFETAFTVSSAASPCQRQIDSFTARFMFGNTLTAISLHAVGSLRRSPVAAAFAGDVITVATQATVPNSEPMPAVSAMASAPQNVTRMAPRITPAPPARAANPPRSARNTSEVPDTRAINAGAGAKAVTNRGAAAPTAKLAADADDA